MPFPTPSPPPPGILQEMSFPPLAPPPLRVPGSLGVGGGDAWVPLKGGKGTSRFLGPFLGWGGVSPQEVDLLDISVIRDTRTGRYARVPKVKRGGGHKDWRPYNNKLGRRGGFWGVLGDPT